MSDTVEDLLHDLVSWLAKGPQPYREVMEGWRTSCPRLSIWEEAQARGLVLRRAGPDGPEIGLTDAGRAWLTHRRAAA